MLKGYTVTYNSHEDRCTVTLPDGREYHSKYFDLKFQSAFSEIQAKNWPAKSIRNKDKVREFTKVDRRRAVDKDLIAGMIVETRYPYERFNEEPKELNGKPITKATIQSLISQGIEKAMSL